MGRHNVFPGQPGTGNSPNAPCVFLSHGPHEKKLACCVAAYLDVLALRYYYDENNAVFEAALARGAEPGSALEECVDRGMEHATHLLGLLTARTVRSWRVPYEMGEARGRGTRVAYIVAPDVKSLPEHVRCATLLRTVEEVAAWCEPLAGWPSQALESHFAADYADLREQVAGCGQDDETDGWLAEMRSRILEREPLLQGARDAALLGLATHLAPGQTYSPVGIPVRV